MFDIEQYRENNRIEAKLAHGGLPESLWETYSAFANTLGGYILLGAIESADKSLRATVLPDPEGLMEEFWRLLPKRVSVNLLTKEDVFLQEIGGGRVVVVRVPRALPSERPVYAVGNAYRRGGEGDYKCSIEEIEAMVRDSKPRDGASVPFGMDALCPESIALYRGTLPEDGHANPSIAELLMFGKKEAVLSVFPDFSAVFSGEFSEYNLCRFYFRAHAILCRHEMASALCEALLNTIVNADYHAAEPVKIEFSSEKAVFSNAGSFRIHPERAVRGGVSDARNPTIASFFRRGGLGSGLPHIYRAFAERGLPPPVITELFSPDRILLTLYFTEKDSENAAADLSAYRGVVISYLTEHPKARLSSIASHLGLDKEKTRRLLQDLTGEGMIEPTNGTYRLKI